jgi:methionyl-tRNA formyltransferase
MRIAFAGTPEFALVALRALHAAGHELALVLTQPDRPAGRGLRLQPSPVKQFAQHHALPLAQPRSLRLDGRFPADAQATRAALASAAIEVMVVAAYGLILPPWVLALPPRGCLNIHASLLPRWRGAAPIQRAIEAGDARTGITIMQMEAGLDTGAILLERAVPIGTDDTGATLHDRLAVLGADAVVEARSCLDALVPRAQPDTGATYAHKIDKSEAAIDWCVPADAIERRLRAFDPVPGCTARWAGDVIKVWRGRVVEGSGRSGDHLPAGDGRIVIACGERALEWLEVQPAGGRRMTVAEFLRRQDALGRP